MNLLKLDEEGLKKSNTLFRRIIRKIKRSIK